MDELIKDLETLRWMIGKAGIPTYKQQSNLQIEVDIIIGRLNGECDPDFRKQYDLKQVAA